MPNITSWTFKGPNKVYKNTRFNDYDITYQFYLEIINHFYSTLACHWQNSVSAISTVGLDCLVLHFVILGSISGNLWPEL